MLKTRIAVFVSGGGTNLQALLDAQAEGKLNDGEIVLVLSSNPAAYALQRAEKAGVRSVTVSRKDSASQEEFEGAISRELEKAGIEMIVLAGFMSILSASFTAKWERRIINVHPSLIPSFCGKGYYGLRVHEAALNYGVKVTGATVHYVNEVPDGGQIILQKAVDILPGDTPEVLQRRVMEQAEWQLLPQAAQLVAKRIRDEKSKTERKGQMDVYQIHSPEELIQGNSYVGRGIVIGKTPDASRAVIAYFIMGRSENSRNRVFAEEDGVLYTRPFDESKVADPSLIIYAAMRSFDNKLIVTNGDQTDTIYNGLAAGKSFGEALESRQFEPDAPNLTPRISGILNFDNNDFTYQMSILKSADAEGTACNRYLFSYPALPGLGHFIHTYVCDGSPIPTFQGEPERMAIPDDAEEFTRRLWNCLDENNRISLYVRTVDLTTGAVENRLINKNH